MKLTNNTRLDGRAVRRWITACIKHEGMDVRGYRVILEPWGNRRRACRGFGYYDTLWMKVIVPDEGPLTGTALAQCTATVVHEIAHNRGERHRDMDCDGIRRAMGQSPPPWLVGMVIPLRASVATPKAKPTANAQADAKLARVLELTTAWERKAKTARTKLRKLAVRRRYYERRLAAMRAPSITSLTEQSP